jgi:hypothetical protein
MLKLNIVGKRPDRDRLKAALSQQDAKQQVFGDAKANVARLQTEIRVIDDAALMEANATRAVQAARERWAQCGTYAAARELQELTEAADEASRAAKNAAANSDVLRRELARAEDALRTAQVELRSREIAKAAGVTLADEYAAKCAEYELGSEVQRARRREITALAELLNPSRREYERDAEYASEEGYSILEASLTRGKILPWDQERSKAQDRDFVEGVPGRDEAMMEQLKAPLRARAAQLRADPDA